jgi:hypothetical protein
MLVFPRDSDLLVNLIIQVNNRLSAHQTVLMAFVVDDGQGARLLIVVVQVGIKLLQEVIRVDVRKTGLEWIIGRKEQVFQDRGKVFSLVV